MRAVIAVAVSALLIGGCGGGSGDRGGGGSAEPRRSDRLVDFSLDPPYVNALDIDPASGDFLLTTNRGFFRIDADKGTVAHVRGTVSAGGASAEVGTFLAVGPEELDLALSDGTIVSTSDGGERWKTAFRP